ncbi:hypothetical protein P4O66_000895 [Electrophorus voltai]|uniref:Ig-like domain-containing protein n=1 Tax=Electrophorus voltai TaxID=2609070 RepID=A0AAD8ZFE1_9TELE|nr:hypothetical protein P4O66_000895 [Electrophorus voltai]
MANGDPEGKQRTRHEEKASREASRYQEQAASILLANVQSLDNKLDDLLARIKFQRDIRDCNLLCFTESWLNPAVPNHIIQPAEFFSVHRMDRTADSGKSRGGGVCVMVNNSWCNNANVVTLARSYSPNLELLALKLCPFYLPREFTSVIINTLYNPPQANMDTALCELHEALTQFQAQHRDAALIVVGDFNSANLKRATEDSSCALSIVKTEQSDSATYYCAVAFMNIITFGDGTVLVIKDSEAAHYSNHTLLQQPMLEPVHPGNSVTLQCTVLTEICVGGHSFYWFRHESFVYELTKRNLSLSDAGTYHCAVALCEEILFGNGTTLFFNECYKSIDKKTLPQAGEAPTCIITLYAGSVPVFHGDFTHDRRFKVNKSETQYTLTISDLKQADAGIYYCAVRDYNLVVFSNGVFLKYEGPNSKHHHYISGFVLLDQTDNNLKLKETVHPGDSVTLQCTVLTESCAGEHSVYWFRHVSGESHPGIIYTHGDSSDQLCLLHLAIFLIANLFDLFWVPNHAIQPAKFFSVHRMDRTADSGKSRGGGVCVMINNSWCNNANVVTLTRSCSTNLELLALKLRPFYLPREFSSVIINTVYIPPQANMDTALCELHEALTQFQAQHQDAALIVVGDFNGANLKCAVPNLYQHVTLPTRGNRTLNHCYTPYKDSYKALAHPPFGKSDHAAIFLLPKYKQRLKREAPFQREVKRWTDQSVAALQDALDDADWDMFWRSTDDVSEFTEAVVEFIGKLVDNTIPRITIKKFPNQKPWVDKTIREALNSRTAAYNTGIISGNMDKYKSAAYGVWRAVREAKRRYGKKLETQFQQNGSRSLWPGCRTITDYRSPPSGLMSADESLANELNTFFTCFEATSSSANASRVNTNSANASSANASSTNANSASANANASASANGNGTIGAANGTCAEPKQRPLIITESDMKRMFKRVNTRKAVGPDGICGRVLKACADQLAPVFIDIFNLSLMLGIIPSSFKRSTIVPIPKKPQPHPTSMTTDLLPSHES